MDKNFAIADLTNLDVQLGPKLLKLVYWIGLAGIVLWALLVFVGALGMLQYSALSALGMMLGAVLGGAFGILFWRVVIEIYMVFFKIHDRVTEIKAKLDAKP